MGTRSVYVECGGSQEPIRPVSAGHNSNKSKYGPPEKSTLIRRGCAGNLSPRRLTPFSYSRLAAGPLSCDLISITANSYHFSNSLINHYPPETARSRKIHPVATPPDDLRQPPNTAKGRKFISIKDVAFQTSFGRGSEKTGNREANRERMAGGWENRWRGVAL